MKKIFSALVLLLCIFTGLITFQVDCRALDKESAFRFPVRAYNDGNYRVALRGFNEFLGNFSDDSRVPLIKFWKAEAHLHLKENKDAYDILLKLHRNHPAFKLEKVLHRLAYLGKDLGRQEEIINLVTTEKLQKVPILQNYLIKWRLARNQDQELYSRLSLLPENKLTETAQNFLSHQHRGQVVQNLEAELGRGTWNPSIRRKLSELPSVTRRNLLILGIKKLWNKDDFSTIVNFGGIVPGKWQSPEFKLYYAEAAVKQGKLKLAEKIYRQLVGQAEYKVQVNYSLAWLLYRGGELEQAQKYLEEVNWQKDMGKISVRAERMLGNILLQQHRLAQAQAAYKRAINLSNSPDFKNKVRFWLGWSYFEADMLRDAYQQFSRVKANGQISYVDVYQVRGRTALGLGKYSEAETNYNQALKFSEAPGRTHRIKYELAQTYYEWGKVKTSFNMLLKLSRQDLEKKMVAPVQLALGRTALEVGKTTLAWSVFKSNQDKLLTNYPVEFRYFAGQSALQVNHYEQARTYFDQIVEKFPTSVFSRPAVRMSFRVELAQIDPKNQKQQKRIREKIRQSPPEMRVPMLREWARALLKREVYDKALSLYEEVLLKSNRPSLQAQTISSIVKIYLNQDATRKALNYLDKQLSELPTHPQAAKAVYQLLLDLYEKRQLDKLEKWTERYLTKFPQSQYHGQVYFMQGELQRSANNYVRATKKYRQALDNSVTETLKLRCKYRLGQVYLARRKYNQADNFLRLVARKKPDFVSARELARMQAEAAYEIGKNQKVISLLKQFEQLSSADRLLKAKALFNLAEYEQAKSLLTKLEPPETSELNPARSFWLGQIAFRQGNLSVAEEHWYQTFYLYKEWSGRDRLIYHLIKLAEKQNNTEQAQKMRKRLKQEFPESSYISGSEQ